MFPRSKAAKDEFAKQLKDTNAERKEAGMKELTPEQIKFLTDKAKGYSFIGDIVSRKKENPNYAGKSAAPATGRSGMYK